MNISINVKNKIATVVGSPVIVCGNSDYRLALTFDAEWADQPVKTARFIYVKDGEVKSADVVFNGNEATVPVLTGTREVFVGIYAGNLRTTTPARIPCQQSIRCMDGAPEDPTPSQYDQIIALLNNVPALTAVQYTAQALSEAQKEQARTNLDVMSTTRVGEMLQVVKGQCAPAYTYGTADIEAGSASSAATGTLHFVYE